MSTNTASTARLLDLDVPPSTPLPLLTKALLGAGIAASLFYVAANVNGALRWPQYSSVDWTISELFAIDAPSRTGFLAFSIPYGLLSLAFGIGVVRSASRNHRLRAAGWLLVAVGIVNQFGPFFSMHSRAVIAAGGATFTDTMHIILTIVLSILIMLAMGFSALARGRRFRIYSVATIITLIVFGALASAQTGGLEANTPTPLMGVYERINVGAYLLWMTTLAVVLLRAKEQSGPSTPSYESAS